MENYQNNAERRFRDICEEEKEFEFSYENLMKMHDEEDRIRGLLNNLHSKPNAQSQKLALERKLEMCLQQLAYWKARFRSANRAWKNKIRT